MSDNRFSNIEENLRHIQQRIRSAAERARRDPQSVTLMAVTKTVAAECVRHAVECGVRHVGESRLQDAAPKLEALKDLDLTWHFIGHIQTNKAKKVAEKFAWIHSLDRVELAEKLAHSVGQPLQVLIEVKLHEEPNKSGACVADLPRLIETVRGLAPLQLRGLMAVPPFFENPEDVRPHFRQLRLLAQQFELKELSMGMTHDFEVAVEEGATMIRIGTGLFGARDL